MSKARLSSDTKAILRELRRYDYAVESQLKRLADSFALLGMEAGDAIQNGALELVLRRRAP